MYGAEYQTLTDSNSHVHGCYNFDVLCAVCYVSNCNAVYIVPAKYTCPTGWTRGYLMAQHYTDDHYHTQHTCVDTAF